MNTNIDIHTTAIMVTDPQTAIKANRNANAGFRFHAIGAPVKNVKFDLIIFACNLSTHVMKEWAKDICQNCLAEGGSVMGMLTDGSVHMATPKISDEEAIKQNKAQQDEQVKLVEELNPQEKKTARRKAKKKVTKKKATK